MPRANPQQDKKYYSYDPRQTHSDFHNKIGQEETCAAISIPPELRAQIRIGMAQLPFSDVRS